MYGNIHFSSSDERAFSHSSVLKYGTNMRTGNSVYESEAILVYIRAYIRLLAKLILSNLTSRLIGIADSKYIFLTGGMNSGF